MSDRPNILLVILDTVRAGNCSVYGYQRDTTPFLQEFADEATLYTNARAPGSDSILSHTSMWSGLSVPEHGVYSYLDDIETGHSIWETLQKEGYATAGFTENPFFVVQDIGLGHGLDTIVGPLPKPFASGLNPREYIGRTDEFVKDAFNDRTPIRSAVNGLATKLRNGRLETTLDPMLSRSARDYVDAFLDWHTDQNEPWGAVINLMDAHGPYYPSSRHDKWSSRGDWRTQTEIKEMIWEFAGGKRPWHDRQRLLGLYDGGIREADSGVRRLVDELRRRGALEDTLLVITSDHGEAFGEESRIRDGVRISQHSTGIHECLLHVPLLVSYPGQTESAREEAPVSLSAFPDVVLSAIDGGNPSFDTGSPVVSAMPGIEQRKTMSEKAREFCNDEYDLYTGNLYATYDSTDDSVKKTIRWKSKEVEVMCRDANRSFRTDSRTVANGGIDFGTDSIAIEQSESVDDEILEQLSDLGYT